MTRRILAPALLLVTLPCLAACLDGPERDRGPGAAPEVDPPPTGHALERSDGGDEPVAPAVLAIGPVEPVVAPPGGRDDATPPTAWVEIDPGAAAPPPGIAMREAWNGTRVGWSADGREVWITWDGEPGYHARLVGPLPEGARLLPLLEPEGYADVELLLVHPGEPDATVLPWWEGATTPRRRMWIAPAPGAGEGSAALTDTVALRYLRTCPGLMETCGLYGAPEQVAAAEDPVAPLGGWFLRWDHAELGVPPEARWSTVATYESAEVPDARLEVEAMEPTPGEAMQPTPGEAMQPTPGEDDPLAERPHRAWLVLDGERTHAFDFLAPRFDEMGFGGVSRDGDRLVAWLWRSDFVALNASEHDPATGARLSPPLAAAGEPYFEVECGYVLYNTRPMPVRTPDGLTVALFWGDDGALLFERGSERGRFVRTGVRPETLEPWGDEVPEVLHVDPTRDAVDPAELWP